MVEPEPIKRVFIRKRSVLKGPKKYYAEFLAQGNNETLAHTQHYHSGLQCQHMLERYFPDWEILHVGK